VRRLLGTPPVVFERQFAASVGVAVPPSASVTVDSIPLQAAHRAFTVQPNVGVLRLTANAVVMRFVVADRDRNIAVAYRVTLA
jgi:hypothetical protein